MAHARTELSEPCLFRPQRMYCINGHAHGACAWRIDLRRSKACASALGVSVLQNTVLQNKPICAKPICGVLRFHDGPGVPPRRRSATPAPSCDDRRPTTAPASRHGAVPRRPRRPATTAVPRRPSVPRRLPSCDAAPSYDSARLTTPHLSHDGGSQPVMGGSGGTQMPF